MVYVAIKNYQGLSDVGNRVVTCNFNDWYKEWNMRYDSFKSTHKSWSKAAIRKHIAPLMISDAKAKSCFQIAQIYQWVLETGKSPNEYVYPSLQQPVVQQQPVLVQQTLNTNQTQQSTPPVVTPVEVVNQATTDESAFEETGAMPETTEYKIPVEVEQNYEYEFDTGLEELSKSDKIQKYAKLGLMIGVPAIVVIAVVAKVFKKK